MKSVIVNPFIPIPKSDKSHVRGWAIVWAQRLNADIATKDTDLSKYDNIYIEHGVNFSGSMNLFGGFNNEVFERVYNLITAVNKGANLFSLDWNIHDCKYSNQIKKRIGANTTSKKVDFNFLIDFEKTIITAKTITMDSLKLFDLILGDSHSAAYSEQHHAIKRINGQLLYSAMKNDLCDFIQKYSYNYNEITLCLGSIDIRFHALNKISAKDFANQYAQQVIKAQNKLNIKINVCAPVPIEYEQRRIPKTGQYGGMNFKVLEKSG